MADETRNGVVNSAFEIENVDGTPYTDEKKTDLDFSDKKSKNQNTTNEKLKRYIKTTLLYLIHVVVIVYFAFATYHYHDINNYECTWNPTDECGIRFCSGYGMLVLLVGFIYVGLFYYLIFKPKIGLAIYAKHMKPLNKRWMKFSRTRSVSIIMFIMLLVAFAGFLAFQVWEKPHKLKALIAPCFFIAVGWAFSAKRSAIQWRCVITGITSQFILGIICIRWEVGRKIFECLGDKVATFLGFTGEGSRFVYGDMIIDSGAFAFAVLSTIFFFSFFISILYYINVMQWVVMKLGWILQQILGTTVCESVTAAANIFLGMSESPLLIRPYIKILTASEIHSIMVSGFATVSGTVLAAYLQFGASAAHLITASVMAAPASLALSKLYLPETEESKTSSKNIELEKSEDTSVLDAASSGANSAIPIVLGIVANIIAFVAFIAFLNAMVNWLGTLVGWYDIDFEYLFSKIFMPLAWAMGVPWYDCDKVAKVISTKMTINEFVAYERLGVYIKNEDIDARSAGIATFAVCGFANPSSLGILIGTLGAMAPNRRKLITRVAFRAFVVGSIVCFMSASFVGILMEEDEERAMYKRLLSNPERKNITLAFFKEN